MHAGLFIIDLIAHDEGEIVKLDFIFCQKIWQILFEIEGFAADLAVNADTWALAVDKTRRV